MYTSFVLMPECPSASSTAQRGTSAAASSGKADILVPKPKTRTAQQPASAFPQVCRRLLSQQYNTNNDWLRRFSILKIL